MPTINNPHQPSRTEWERNQGAFQKLRAQESAAQKAEQAEINNHQFADIDADALNDNTRTVEKDTFVNSEFMQREFLEKKMGPFPENYAQEQLEKLYDKYAGEDGELDAGEFNALMKGEGWAKEAYSQPRPGDGGPRPGQAGTPPNPGSQAASSKAPERLPNDGRPVPAE